MKTSVRWGPIAGIAMSILIVGQASAASWSAPKRINWGDGYAQGLAMAGNTAVAMYYDGMGAFTRRSVDGGVSWEPPVSLTSLAPGTGYDHSIGAYGTFVDVVYEYDGRLRYRRSIDAGASFGAAVNLVPTGVESWSPVVAHGPGGTVVVAWAIDGAVRARVSTNNGVTFGAARTIGLGQTYTDDPVDVAVGDGVIYAAYYLDSSRLRLKRSIDGGVSWSAAFKVSNVADSYAGLDIAAAGTHAYIAYAADDVRIFSVNYRRTVDRGATWAAARDLSPQESDPASQPQLFLRGGVVRAVYTTCIDNWDYCDPMTPQYTQSSDGVTWTAPQRLLPTTFEDGRAVGVGSAGKPIVLISGWRESDGWGVFVRRRL